jgi:hypothetical protein
MHAHLHAHLPTSTCARMGPQAPAHAWAHKHQRTHGLQVVAAQGETAAARRLAAEQLQAAKKVLDEAMKR